MKFLKRCRKRLEIAGQPSGSRKRSVRKSADYDALEKRNLLAVFTVDTVSDVVDLDDGLVSLREAITAANNNAPFGDAAAGDVDGDRVVVANHLAGQTITLGGTELAVTDDLNIRAKITIDANHTSRIFAVDSRENLRLSDLTLVNGLADNGGAISFLGGGRLTLFRVDVEDSKTFSGPRATGLGGGVYAVNSNVRISVSGISNNRAGEGGGVYLSGGRLDVIQSEMTANEAFEGGAVKIENGQFFSAANTLSNNYGYRKGGAIYLEQTTGPAIIQSSTFSDNLASVEGGGVYVGQGASLLIANNSIFSENRTGISGFGGAIFNLGNLKIRDALFSANKSGSSGGAISDSKGNLRITDSEFVSNGTTGDGGAIYTEDSTLTILGSQLNENRAFSAVRYSGSTGGAIYSQGSETVIGNSTLSQNTASSSGGAVYGIGAGLRIFNSTISTNTDLGRTSDFGSTVNTGGGGIYLSDGVLQIADSQISDNRSLNGQGGGIRTRLSTVTITGSTISRNTSVISTPGNLGGGGLSFYSGDTLIVDSLFSSNHVKPASSRQGPITGGAISTTHEDGVEQVGSLTILGGSFDSNLVSGNGGAIYTSGVDLKIRPSSNGVGTVFKNNQAINSAGGAIFVSEKTANIRYAAFRNNKSFNGGALHINDTPSTIRNSEFNGNRAEQSGGAIFLTDGEAFELIDVVFANNSATKGDDIFNQSDV